MPPHDALSRGRAAFERNEWRRAYERLSAADLEAPLEPSDLERLATAAYLVGEEAEAAALWTRAHHELVDRGDLAGAARWGFWLSLNLLLAGEMARSSGWLARSERLLHGNETCCARGYGQIVSGLMAMGRGASEEARHRFTSALQLAQQHTDRNLLTISLLAEGQLLIASGCFEKGFKRLDEAMVAVTADDVSPIFAGIVYCAVILSCQEAYDLRRASEWTAAMNEWCASQPDLVPYRGQCLVHRSEVLQMRGEWAEALVEAERACEQLAQRSQAVVGRARYQCAELHRLLGNFALAERMYREAAEHGCEPLPGLALLQLARGEGKSAAEAIRAIGSSAGGAQSAAPGSRNPKLLGPCVEILLDIGDIEGAREAAEKLETAAAEIGAPFLVAAAAEAAGSIQLAMGQPATALVRLRAAWHGWRDLAMPYEAARAQTLIGCVCRALGDCNSARMHFDAARAAFTRLGAAPDLRKLHRLSGQTDVGRGGILTQREREVLGLATSGETNRGIAAALSISEHTVARHLSNIYDKLGVTSRTAATTAAYEQKLLPDRFHSQD